MVDLERLREWVNAEIQAAILSERYYECANSILEEVEEEVEEAQQEADAAFVRMSASQR